MQAYSIDFFTLNWLNNQTIDNLKSFDCDIDFLESPELGTNIGVDVLWTNFENIPRGAYLDYEVVNIGTSTVRLRIFYTTLFQISRLKGFVIISNNGTGTNSNDLL